MNFGTRAFAVAGPKAWNQLPMHIRARESVGSFKTAQNAHFGIIQCTGLLSIVTQPTRAVSYLDRIYVSSPIYSIVRVVKSLVRSDHNAVGLVAYADRPQLNNKTVAQKTFRPISPSQHAAFLQYILVFVRCEHRTSNIGNIGPFSNIGTSGTATRRCGF